MEIFYDKHFRGKSKNMPSHIWLKLCLELHVLCMKMFIVFFCFFFFFFFFFSGIIIINDLILKKTNLKVIYFLNIVF